MIWFDLIYLFLRTRKTAIRAATSITTITTTITPTIVPVGIPVPVRASLLPTDGIADLLEPPGVVGSGISVPAEVTTLVSNAVGFVVKGCVGLIKVESVVSSVNEFDGWLSVVIGETVDDASVPPCGAGVVGAGIVGAGAGDFKRD